MKEEGSFDIYHLHLWSCFLFIYCTTLWEEYFLLTTFTKWLSYLSQISLSLLKVMNWITCHLEAYPWCINKRAFVTFAVYISCFTKFSWDEFKVLVQVFPFDVEIRCCWTQMLGTPLDCYCMITKRSQWTKLYLTITVFIIINLISYHFIHVAHLLFR